MAVIRNSKNGNSVMFVDERGFVYTVNKRMLLQFVMSKSVEPLGLVLLPMRVNSDRFQSSKIFVDNKQMSVREAFDEKLVDSSYWLGFNGMGEDGFGSRDLKNKKSKPKKVIGDIKI